MVDPPMASGVCAGTVCWSNSTPLAGRLGEEMLVTTSSRRAAAVNNTAGNSMTHVELVTDEPGWQFTGFPGFEPCHLRVWRSAPRKLIAVVTQLVDENLDPVAGTSLIEAHELVLQQLHADYPGDEIEYIFCESSFAMTWDVFTRITVHPDRSEVHQVLLTNDFVSRLGADRLYRTYQY